jgi:hypothetical protein
MLRRGCSEHSLSAGPCLVARVLMKPGADATSNLHRLLADCVLINSAIRAVDHHEIPKLIKCRAGSHP